MSRRPRSMDRAVTDDVTAPDEREVRRLARQRLRRFRRHFLLGERRGRQRRLRVLAQVIQDRRVPGRHSERRAARTIATLEMAELGMVRHDD